MFAVESLIALVIYLIVIGLIFGLLWWLVDYCQLPEPFNKVVRVVLAILAVLIVISVLLSFLGGIPVFRR